MPCGTRLHYEPTRNPETGRALPTQGGKCRYPVKWPVMPESYKEHGVWGPNCYRFPYPRIVYTGSCPDCPTWEQKPATKTTAPDKTLFGADSDATQTFGK